MAVNKVIYGDQTLMDLTGDTVTADKLLSGATAHNASGEQITGSMLDKSGTSGTINTASDSFTIPQGYHDGQGTVSISENEQAKIIPENIKVGVHILGVTGTASGGETDTSDATAGASDILAGQTAYVDGEKVIGTMINRGQVTGSMSYANDVFAISQGYHDGTGSVTIDSAEQAKIIPGNIKSGVSILGVTGDYEGEGGSSADTSAIEPYIKNFNSGWAGKGNGLWTYESPSDAYSDIYQVTAEHIYFLSLGANVSTRFRVIFSTVDLSTITSGTLQCTAVNTKNYDDPEPFTNLTFTPSEDGYLVIQKDNTGNNEIKTYLYDKTASWL